MSVLIKGMEMPENCELCMFHGVDVENGCFIKKAFCLMMHGHEKPTWCPLEEVPETHDKRTETHACDYISRDDAIAVAGKYFESDGCNGSDVAMDIQSDLLGLPSAQPEIIHCGNCKYKDDGIDEDGIPFLKCLHGRSYGGTRINDFCSWAERREDG